MKQTIRKLLLRGLRTLNKFCETPLEGRIHLEKYFKAKYVYDYIEVK